MSNRLFLGSLPGQVFPGRSGLQAALPDCLPLHLQPDAFQRPVEAPHGEGTQLKRQKLRMPENS